MAKELYLTRLQDRVLLGLRDRYNKVRRRTVTSRPWDGRHHPVFRSFACWSGPSDGKSCYDFLGIKVDPKFRRHFTCHPEGEIVSTSYPLPNYEYFEFIFVLQTVLGVPEDRVLVMGEIGAAYGRWLVFSHRAFKQLGRSETRLIGVEMESRRFGWMREHFLNNELNPEEHTLIHAAVSDQESLAFLPAGYPPDLSYGLSLLNVERVSYSQSKRSARTFREDSTAVPCLTLNLLLEKQPILDLLHLDIQGEEGPVILGTESSCLHEKVRRIIVATHSPSSHRKLRKLFLKHNWQIIYDFPVRGLVDTEFGTIQFLDGLLACVNLRI